jgi:heptosyltransferase-1
MRFLIVKVSSMGDIIHAMPVVHDLKFAYPDCYIDWVVEEAFTELVRANSQVDEVIPCGLRRWIKRPFNPANWGEIRAFKRELGRLRYDAVFELQGLLKTAWICRQTNGPSYGFDRAAAKEPVSAYLLTHPVPIDTRLHIIEQLRSVPAQALGYSVPGDPVIEWNFDAVHQDWQLPTNAVVLFHMTAAAYKLWPVENWIALAQGIAAVGLTPVLPWGSEAEHARAQQIAAHVPGAVIAPRLTIAQWGKSLPQARAVVGLDTGLSHLAAARGAPSVFLFGATPLWRIAPYWGEQHVTVGEPGHWPAVSEVLHTVCDLIHRCARPHRTV